METGGGSGVRKVPGCPLRQRGEGGPILKDSKARGEVRGPGRGPLISASRPLLGCCKTTRAFLAWVPDLVQIPGVGFSARILPRGGHCLS